MNKVTLASAVARLKRREFRKQKSIFNLEQQQQEKKLKEQEILEEPEDLSLDDTLQERFEDKDNIAFTFEKGITREEIRETNHKLRAQVRKQLNIQENLDPEIIVKIEGPNSIEEIIEIFTQNSRKSCEIEGIKVTDQQFKDITEAAKLLSGISLDKQDQEN